MVVHVSATDKLEKLLKERCARYKIIERKGKGTLAGALWRYPTSSGTGYYVAQAVRYGNTLTCSLHLTPEQAVEATLGLGTCKAIPTGKGTAICSKCGVEYMGSIMTNEPPDYVTALRRCPNCGRKVVD